MFTGLIETVGVLRGVHSRGNYRVFAIESSLPWEDIELGESIACDGACLTVVEAAEGCFTVEASQETIARTIAGTYAPGARIHLERALQVGSRMGGHMVSGHIDDTGLVEYLRSVGESLELAVCFDPAFDPLVIEKGSVAINGVSLTVNETTPGRLTVNLIPHTASATTLRDLAPGSRVNLEFDMIGKYVLKATGQSDKKGLTIDKLLESGW